MIDELKLDLACGDNKREDYFGIDIAKTNSVDAVMDLQKFPWDIKSESVEEVNCSHYIEHIPHVNIKSILEESTSFDEFKQKLLNTKDGAIDFFNELYRILKPGGKVTLIAPYYSSMRATGDPTHTRFISEFSCYYLSKEWRDANKLEHYGLDCDFDINVSYRISEEMSLKSQEVRSRAFKYDLNTVDDIIIELIKK